MSKLLGTRNVQAVVSAECHKVLRDEAYARNVPLRDLVKMVLTEWAAKVQENALKS